MATRTVRLDAETEEVLEELQRGTGESVSALLKRGLVTLKAVLNDERGSMPFRIYETIDLGEGGYAAAPARRAKKAVADAIRKKHKRR